MGFSYNVNVLNQKGSPALYTDTFANRPNFGYAGRLFIANDTSAIYEDTGTAWVLIANVSSGAGTLQQVTTNGNTSNVGISITAGGLSTNSLTDTALTLGSVLFAGAAGLVTQDNAAFFWDDTNNRLGINTTTPTNTLDLHYGGTGSTLGINNTAGNQSAIVFVNTGVNKWRIGNTSSNNFDFYNTVLALTAISIDGASNSANFTADLLITNTASNIRIYLTNNTATTGKSWYLNSKSDGKLYIGTVTNGDIINIDQTGTTNFASNITALANIFSNTTTQANFTLGSAGANFGQIFANGSTAWGLGYNSAASTIGTAVLNWTSGGRVGIGTSTPSTLLNLYNSTAATSLTLTIENATNNYNSQINFKSIYGGATAKSFLVGSNINSGGGSWEVYDNTSAATRLAISNGGSVLINQTTDDTVNKLQVTGSAKITGAVTLSNLAGTGSRAVLADANGLLSAPVSDISVKQNIEPLKYGLNTILQLNAVQFEFIESYKNYGEGLQIGAIAQEMEQIIPEAVFTTPLTGLKGIDYNQLNGIYIKAIQDLNNIIDSLLKRIELLENK